MRRAAFDVTADWEISVENFSKQTEWCKQLIAQAKAQGKSDADVKMLEAMAKTWEEKTEKLRNEKS
jgi:predicted kinase